MAGITAGQVKELREATNVGMMECKRALEETGGDMDEAKKLLRKMGMAVAEKKSSRAANEGLIGTAATEDGKTVSLVEVNCETDFVARNETFRNFVSELAQRACEMDGSIAEEARDKTTAMIAEIGENIVVGRNARFVLSGPGMVSSYVHLNGKIGVLLEVSCEKEETAGQDGFRELCRDLILHVAAAAPDYLTDDEVPEEVLSAEREIYASQVKDKPEHVVEKIITGKLKKFCSEICLMGQGFVKEPKKPIQKLLEESSKSIGDRIAVRRFLRCQIGQ
ncbi:MAG: translation elongation factor Ts [Kiritimatiellia bacterium]